MWGLEGSSSTRTVDVHVRRVRAALGEHGDLVGTVRRVGYKFALPTWRTASGSMTASDREDLGRAG